MDNVSLICWDVEVSVFTVSEPCDVNGMWQSLESFESIVMSIVCPMTLLGSVASWWYGSTFTFACDVSIEMALWRSIPLVLVILPLVLRVSFVEVFMSLVFVWSITSVSFVRSFITCSVK